MADARPGLAAPADASASVAAWDVPTRLFKWGLVLLVAAAWATQAMGSSGIGLHIWNGYAILVLLVFRLLWGVVGSSTARFATWVTWPWTALVYGLRLLQGRTAAYLGHNPLGGWMILLLLALASSQAVAGLFTVDNLGLNGGPFANLDFGDPTATQKLLSWWHHRGFYVLIALAGIHAATNLWYQFGKRTREPVVSAMVVGRKPARSYADEPALRPAPAAGLRAVLCVAAAVAIVLGGVKLGGGTLPF